MSADIVTFIPRAELTAQENLAAFVDLARNRLTVFGGALKFDKPKWDISNAVNLRGHGNKKHRITFCNIETAGARKGTTPMVEPFATFAKSLVRYWQGIRPVESQQNRMTAMRCLESALRRQASTFSAERIDSHILDLAAVIAVETQGEDIANRVGGVLAEVATFLTDNRLVVVPVAGWKNPIKRPIDVNIKFGEEFERRRDERLPDQEALEALPVAFRMAKEVPDVLVTAGSGLLLVTPDRINEVLSLPVRCERDIPQKATGDRRYGLAWASSKGFDDNIRWISPTCVELTKECIRRLAEVTEPARQIAKWYEDNPGKLFLPEDLVHLRTQQYLSIHEVKEIVGIKSDGISNAWTWCKKNDVNRTQEKRGARVRFADLERAIVSLLPRGFPVLDQRTGLKYSDALFVVRKFELAQSSKGMCYRCMVEAVNINQINNGLGARVEHGSSSVFERLRLRNSKGKFYRITSHQFRHYLNTLAQIGGASEIDIALWSGRADISHNAAYDHMSSEQILDKLRADCDESLPIMVVEQVKKSPLIRRSNFSQQVIPAAHANDLGWCIHPYSDSPCQLFRDCINCSEQVCIKGAEGRLENVRRAIDETEFLLANAIRELGEAAYGADHWVELDTERLERLKQLYSILTDPNVPDGTPIRLNVGNPPTLMRAAIDGRRAAFGPDAMLMGAADGDAGDTKQPLRLEDLEELELQAPDLESTEEGGP